MHFHFVWPEIKKFMGGQNFSCIINERWYYWFLGVKSQFKSTIMKTLQGFRSSVTGAFRINAHMKTHLQYFFHFIITVPSAFFIFPVYQHATSLIDHTK